MSFRRIVAESSVRYARVRMLALAVAAFCWFQAVTACYSAVVVSCVGDSVTAGYGLPGSESYPAKLQGILGSAYQVRNCGVTGTTLLHDGDQPYTNTSYYTVSRMSPNVVTIMLGSNDAKPWNWANLSHFISDYQTLIAAYTNLSTRPRVLICTPPPAWTNGAAINPDMVATNIAPLVRQVATNLDVQLIDIQSLMQGHREWFPDGVHPNSQGTSVMAAIFYNALTGETNPPALSIASLSANRVGLNWDLGGGGWVLQSSPGVGVSNAWTVVSVPVSRDQSGMHVTNSVSSASGYYRLWNPSALAR
jgi:acyl-CoA thioesterase I